MKIKFLLVLSLLFPLLIFAQEVKFDSTLGDYRDSDVATAATGDEINTGTDTVKMATSKAIADSRLVKTDSDGKLPAIDGSRLLNLPPASMISCKSIGVEGSGADYIVTGAADAIFAEAISNSSAGDTLIILPGTYTFTSQLAVDKSLFIRGFDRTTTILQTTGRNKLLNITANGCSFEYLQFKQIEMDVAWDAVVVSGHATSFRNCYFNMSKYAVSVGGMYCEFRRNLFDGDCGLNIGNSAMNATIEENIFGYASLMAYGILNGGASGLNKSVIMKNSFWAYAPIKFSGAGNCSDVKIIANTFRGASNYAAIEIDDSSGTATTNIVITKNTFTVLDTPKYCIQLKGVQSSSIEGNIFGNATDDYIRLQDGANGHHSVGNLISNNTGGILPIGGITEISGSDYNSVKVNNSVGTVTLVGAHSETDAVGGSTVTTTIINTDGQNLVAGSFNSNAGATQSYTANLPADATDGQTVEVLNSSLSPTTTTTFLAHFENNGKDYSSFNHTPTDGGVTYSTTYKKFGSYGSVPSTGALSYPDSDAFYFGVSTTVELWVYGLPTDKALIGQGGVNSNDLWMISVHSPLGLYVRLGNSQNGGTSHEFLQGDTTGWNASGWNHIAVVFNRDTLKIDAYLNGIRVMNRDFVLTDIGNISAPLTIGLCPNQPWSAQCDKYIDEVLIDKSVKYTGATCIVPTAPFDNHDLIVNPADADQILPLTDAVGDSVKLYLSGDYLKLRSDGAHKWWVIGKQGTPVDNN